MKTITDHWLIEGDVRAGKRSWRDGMTTVLLSEAFDRWERIGIDLSRPFIVVVDTVGQALTVTQEAE